MRALPSLLNLFRGVRARTEELAAPLDEADQVLQSMPQASPTKWHRAHTTWFWETFVLLPRGVPVVDARYDFLFNSYYETVGPRVARVQRGMLSRPSLREVAAYREIVDGRVAEVLGAAPEKELAELAPIVHLGCAHEEQHQELLLTDILHAFAQNPILPAYRAGAPARATATGPDEAEPLKFVTYEGGVQSIGAEPDAPFAFDNELPRHKRIVTPFALADRLLTVGELKAFVRDRGYESPSLWLSDGLDFVRAAGVNTPLYGRMDGGSYVLFGMDGEREALDHEPIAHVSYYEADALARWLGARLPTEAEWEVAASHAKVEGNFLDTGALRAKRASPGNGVRQLFGDAWEWTRSAYEAYPGYAPARGALGEYNGKFMANQMVLRGGSCFTPMRHLRASYRNFWHAETRFQMTGVRLARDV